MNRLSLLLALILPVIVVAAPPPRPARLIATYIMRVYSDGQVLIEPAAAGVAPATNPPSARPFVVRRQPAVSTDPASFPGQCQAIATSTGVRCRCRVAKGSQFCRYHQYNPRPSSGPPASP